MHEIEPSSGDVSTRFRINPNPGRIEPLIVFKSTLMKRSADIDFVSFDQDRSKFFEYIQVVRDLP